MTRLTRLLILMAVALMAARPVMACCLVGHGQPAVAEIQAQLPPCHDTAPTLPGADEAMVSDLTDRPDCPGCADCDSAVMQAQSASNDAVLTPGPSETPLAVLSVAFPGFDHPPVVFKTGPPADPAPVRLTPITLRQRLLI